MSVFPAIEGWVTLPAPAKLNLFLRILGRRADGYHELQTVFRLLDWGDTVFLRARSDDRIVRVGPAVAGVDPSADLMVRAAELLQKSCNFSKGVDIGIEKRIPIGGGFGGGSSDAATVLMALDRLWGLDQGVDQLARLGRTLGADVPVFVHGQTAWAEGVGERLTPLPRLEAAWYVVASPGVHASTAELFRAVDLTRDAPPAKMADFLSGVELGNAFEPVLRRREPAVEAMFTALSSIGRPRLTGSGSGCYVEFADGESAQQALAALPAGLHAWLARSADRSPLLDAVAETPRGVAKR